jgi:hypothetical protein
VKKVDVPITAVFLALFAISAAWHMIIFQKNIKRGHKFVFNAALFGMIAFALLVTLTDS